MVDWFQGRSRDEVGFSAFIHVQEASASGDETVARGLARSRRTEALQDFESSLKQDVF